MHPRPTYRQRRKARKKYGEITGLRTWRLAIAFFVGCLMPLVLMDANIADQARGEGIPTPLMLTLAIAWFLLFFIWMYGRWLMRKIRPATTEQT